jgi:hypothetical protein
MKVHSEIVIPDKFKSNLLLSVVQKL